MNFTMKSKFFLKKNSSNLFLKDLSKNKMKVIKVI